MTPTTAKTGRPLRIALIALVAVIVVIIASAGIFLAQFDPNSLKPRIEEAVKRATGRELALNGPIGLKLSLTPTIEVRDAAFANPPGFSRPQMATLQSVELRLALLPLLSRQIQIASLALNQPDILLETNPAGQPNWKLTPEVSPAAPPGSQAPASAQAPSKTTVSIESVSIRDGRIVYRDDRTGQSTTLGLPMFQARAASPDAPLHVESDASYNGNPFHVIADTGSLTRLQDPAATSPWPVKLILITGGTAAGARLSVEGSLTQPMEGKGYTLAIAGAVPDTAALAPYLPGIKPPQVHDVAFSAKLADSGGAMPAISALTLHVGAADLGTQAPGLMLDKLDISAADLNQPVALSAAGKLGGEPLALGGTLGPLADLAPGAHPAPFPIDVNVQAAGATAATKGTVADLRNLAGVNLAVAARIPDLSALSGLARNKLPAIRTIALGTTLADVPGGLRHGATLHQMVLTTADGDISGDITLGLGDRPALTAALRSNRIDADAFQAAVDRARPPAAPAAPESKPSSPSKPKGGGRLFSDQPIPFDLLRSADGDVSLQIADLHSGGAEYRALITHAVLKNGALSVDPLAGDLPAGHMQATFSADASKPAPAVHLTVHAPGLALKTILELAHEPSIAQGNLEVYADLRGAGDSQHAIAASLDGTLGIALAGGTIDNRLLGSVLGRVMDSLNALDLVGKGGVSELRCFALHATAQNGVAHVNPLALNSSLLTIAGSGAINLGAETLALELRPQGRVGGTGVVVPMVVSGPIREPSVQVNKIGAAESNAGTVAGAVIGNATPLGIVGGMLGADKLLEGGSGDMCPAALAAARGRGAPAAPAATAKPAKPNEPPPNPGAVLRNLFR
ncbi:MAG TPA: AsmA family protein [Rhodopila sp.]|nr:AsmA family protein [Rhodopila sp.]